MRSPTFLLTFVLGLLPSITVASASDNVAVDDLPVFSSSKTPFVLRTQEGFNVILRYHEQIKSYVPVISHTKIRLPEFALHDGNLTTADKSLAAFYPPVPLIFPPVLVPLRFGKHVSPASQAPFVIVTKTRGGKKGLELWALNGPIVVRRLAEGESIFVKVPENIEPTERLHVEVVPLRKSQSEYVDYKDPYADQEFLAASELK